MRNNASLHSSGSSSGGQALINQQPALKSILVDRQPKIQVQTLTGFSTGSEENVEDESIADFYESSCQSGNNS